MCLTGSTLFPAAPPSSPRPLPTCTMGGLIVRPVLGDGPGRVGASAELGGRFLANRGWPAERALRKAMERLVVGDAEVQ